MPDAAFAIDARDLTKRFARRATAPAAVDRLTVSLPQGTVCGLVGPNGAGKTTTLRLLLGLTRPTAGRLRVLGLDPADDPFRLKQLVGYVPDTHHIYPHLRADQALALAAAVYPTWDGAESRRLAARLDVPLRTRVAHLSHGQLAKLALVIALAHDPRLLILDEPTAGLDPLVRRAFLDTVADLVRRRPCTVILSTHILPDVEHLATRLLVLSRGRLLADAAPDDLRASYVKASFLFDPPRPATDDPAPVPGALHVHRSVREWVAIFPADAVAEPGAVARIAADLGARDVLTLPVTLDDAFVHLLSHESPEPAPATATTEARPV